MFIWLPIVIAGLITKLNICLGDIQLSKKIFPGANVYPHNQLPQFVDILTTHNEYPNDNCPDVIWEHLIDHNIQKLPYRICDSYDRGGAEHTNNITLPTIIYENKHIKATIYPTIGGKIGSLIYKKNNNEQRELLFNNPVFQPAAISRLNAWTSGGIEWNWPKVGHTVFSLKNLYIGIINTTKGDIIRMYEFDREMNTTYSIDLFLSNNNSKSPALYTQVTLHNTNMNDIEAYWWTNIGVNISNDSRVLYPADFVVHNSNKGLYCTPFPFNNMWNNGTFNAIDHSYPRNYYQARENFIWGNSSINNCEIPMMSIINKNGDGLIHGATIPGRKYWVWGNDIFDWNRMMFLSSHGHGNYIEIQAGVAPTQSQTFTLKGKQMMQFYEVFAPLSMDGDIGHGNDYPKAVSVSQEILNSYKDDFAAMQEFLSSYTYTPPTEMIWYGSPWGYYHQEIMNDDSIFTTGVGFYNTSANTVDNNNNWNRNNNDFDSMNPWYELIKFGTFSNKTINILSSPLNYAIDMKWVNLLHKSMDLYGETWLHYLHIAIALHSNTNNNTNIKYYYQKSLSLKQTCVGYRGLALLSSSVNETCYWYNKSVNIAINIWKDNGSPSLNPNVNYGKDNDAVLLKNIFAEYFTYLYQQSEWSVITNIVDYDALFPKDLLLYDQSCNIISIAMLVYSTNSDDINAKLAIQKLTDSHYSSSDYLASQLVNIWYDAWYLVNSVNGNINNLTVIQKRNVRVAHPPPMNINFQGAT